jgi:hypothetical protein
MKKLMIAALLISSIAFAFDMPTIQTESAWAKGMTAMACKMDFDKEHTGMIEDAADGGVIYTVVDEEGNKVASAYARSTFILAKKECI